MQITKREFLKKLGLGGAALAGGGLLADEAVTLTFSGQLHDGTTDCIELKKG